MILLEQFKGYISQKKPIPSAVTVKNYLSDIRKFIMWFEKLTGKTFSPKEITKETIDLFQKESLKIFSLTSVNRYLSSLRSFFAFLKKIGEIDIDPFEITKVEIKNDENITNPWALRDFKNYLIENHSSSLTIKNYLIDVKQFLVWSKNYLTKIYDRNILDNNLLPLINKLLIEEYKRKLIDENYFSASSINRKLSSLRKYLIWGQQQKLIPAETEIEIPSLPRKILKKIPRPVDLDNPLSLPKIEAAKQEEKIIKYSKIPPIRLLQKLSLSLDFLIDKILITPQVELIKKIRKKIWEVKGKKIFKEKAFNFYKYSDQNVSKILNIPKANYNFNQIQLENFSPLKKLWIIIRFKRPLWYRNYSTFTVTKYVHFSILTIFSVIIGILFYSNLFKAKNSESLVLGTNTVAQKKLSFSIKLTDKNGQPITNKTNLRFAIYNDYVGSDSANHRLWEDVQTVIPNEKGVAFIELGTTQNGQLAPFCNNGTYPQTLADRPCGIPQNILDSREGLFLGVTINSNAELTPRQQLANVSLANEAQTLQGLIPTTDSALTTNTNAILALNSSGIVSIPGNQPTTIKSQQGSLNISGNGVTLSSEDGTNANVQLSPDGFGLIDVQKPLENTTSNNNIRSSDGQPTAAGAVEIDDLLAVLATSSGQSAVTINQDGDGPIISASSSGAAKFTVDKDGNVIANGNLTGANFFAKNLNVSGNISSSLIPDQVGYYSIGTDIAPWKNIFTENIYLPSTGGVGGYLTLSNGALSPTNISNDLLIGSTSSDSASFHVIATGKNAGNIIASGNLFLKGTSPSVSVLNGQSFTIQTSTDPNNGTSIPRLYISNNGQVGIGTSNPVDSLQVQGDIRIGTGSNGCVKSANGSVIAGTCSSDERLKQNIQPLPNNILNKIVNLQPVTFNWRASEFPQFGFGDQINYGLIAQQVESTFPELVEDNGPGGYKAVKYQLLPMFLLEAIREQQQEIQNIKSTYPNIDITDSGNLSIVPSLDKNNYFSVVDSLGQVLTNFGAFSQIFVGNLTAGVIRSETIVAENINIANQSLQDYVTTIVNQVLASKSKAIVSPITQVDEVHSHILSPLGQNPQIAIVLNNNSVEIRENASSSAVAVLDNAGNASFSGALKSNELAVNGDSTVSGTLFVHKIKADQIEGLVSTNSAQYITNITNNYYASPSSEIATSTPSGNYAFNSNTDTSLPTNFISLGTSSALLTNVSNLQATTATFEQGLISLGPTSLSDTSITGQLSIDGQFIFSNNSINVLGSDLQLQPLGQGGISIAGGKVRFDNNGDLTVNGKSLFRDIVSAGILSPLPNQNLEIRLGNSSINNSILIEDASGSAVASFDSRGNFVASGSATIGKLNFSIIPKAEALSEFEVIATGSAGTTYINPYHREITIDNPEVTENSLIYISPVGSSTQQPFLLRQVPGDSFTVGIRLPSADPVQFNWLIVN